MFFQSSDTFVARRAQHFQFLQGRLTFTQRGLKGLLLMDRLLLRRNGGGLLGLLTAGGLRVQLLLALRHAGKGRLQFGVLLEGLVTQPFQCLQGRLPLAQRSLVVLFLLVQFLLRREGSGLLGLLTACSLRVQLLFALRRSDCQTLPRLLQLRDAFLHGLLVGSALGAFLGRAGQG